MRLWSLHPRHLDRQGLTACWREALLAQAVLAGRTKGYRNHSQLQRFRSMPEPVAAVGDYLSGVADEADTRSYRFDRTRIIDPPDGRTGVAPIEVTEGQLAHEWDHLTAKLTQRSPDWAARWRDIESPDPHPLFRVTPGPVEAWERS
ncbi:MAG: pyrimidine dimer DNA glycosylase/endonuclease V [Propionibacteriaceae bacterium]